MSGLIWKAVLNPSRFLASVLLVLHLGSLFVVYWLNMPWVLKWIMFATLVTSVIYYLTRDVAMRFPFSWREILLSQSEVTVVTQNGSKLTGRVFDTSLVSDYFVILRIKPEGRYFATARIIFRDAISSEMFRQLCVCLRFLK
jgi:hypothetical protein